MSERSCANGHYVLGELKYSHQSPVVCKGLVADAYDFFRQFQFAREIIVVENIFFYRHEVFGQNKFTFEEAV